MHNDSSVLTSAEKTELDQNIQSVVAQSVNSREDLYRLVFQSVAAISEAEGDEKKLADKKGVSRFVGGLTGSNKKLQDKINRNYSVAQYAGLQVLQKLQDQHALSVDLIAAVNNRINGVCQLMQEEVLQTQQEINETDLRQNAYQVETKQEIHTIYRDLKKFAKQIRDDLNNLNVRVSQAEQDAQLSKWATGIAYRMFGNRDYKDLTASEKIVCVAADFLDITHGNWTLDDLPVLKKAMSEIGIEPNADTDYMKFILDLASSDELQKRLGINLKFSREPEAEYLTILGGIQEKRLLSDEDHYMVEFIQEKEGKDEEAAAGELTEFYLSKETGMDMHCEVSYFDLMLELLFNVRQAHEEKIIDYSAILAGTACAVLLTQDCDAFPKGTLVLTRAGQVEPGENGQIVDVEGRTYFGTVYEIDEQKPYDFDEIEKSAPEESTKSSSQAEPHQKMVGNTLLGTFDGLDAITSVVVLERIQPVSCSGWFAGLKSCKDMDLQKLDTSIVTDMSQMFSGCSSLTSLDVSSLDTGCVTDMRGMFSGCSSLTFLDANHFNTGHVTDMSDMFMGCSSLAALDLHHFDTSNVTEMAGLCDGCRALAAIDLSQFATGNVLNMSRMFDHCSNLKMLDVSSFTTNAVTDMSFMFDDCRNLTSLDLSQFDTGCVTTMSHMFSDCRALESLILDGGHFVTGRVTDMSWMFNCCTKLQSLDVSHFDTGKVTDMSWMFRCIYLYSLDVSHFDTSKVTDMEWMFCGCSKLESLDLSHFNTGKVTDMRGMFYGCSNLESLDVKHFDTRVVTNMGRMFDDCRNLLKLDVSSFDTSSVTDMSRMFMYCSSLTSLDVSQFDTSSVTNMEDMFMGCSSLTSLDMSGFDTSSVTNMNAMFYNCLNLTTLGVPYFDVRSVTDMKDMFCACNKLTGIDRSRFDPSAFR